MSFLDSPTFRSNISPPYSESKRKLSKKLIEIGGKMNQLDINFDPDYGGDIFLRNIRLSPNYMALQFR
jgi:hypothetical protein